MPSDSKFVGDEIGCLVSKLGQGRAGDISGPLQNQKGEVLRWFHKPELSRWGYVEWKTHLFLLNRFYAAVLVNLTNFTVHEESS